MSLISFTFPSLSKTPSFCCSKRSSVQEVTQQAKWSQNKPGPRAVSPSFRCASTPPSLLCPAAASAPPCSYREPSLPCSLAHRVHVLTSYWTEKDGGLVQTSACRPCSCDSSSLMLILTLVSHPRALYLVWAPWECHTLCIFNLPLSAASVHRLDAGAVKHSGLCM